MMAVNTRDAFCTGSAGDGGRIMLNVPWLREPARTGSVFRRVLDPPTFRRVQGECIGNDPGQRGTCQRVYNDASFAYYMSLFAGAPVRPSAASNCRLLSAADAAAFEGAPSWCFLGLVGVDANCLFSEAKGAGLGPVLAMEFVRC